MKNRAISEIIRRKGGARFGRIIVVTGARQTGKTTLVRKNFHDFNYLSIEDPVLSEEYKKLTAFQWNLLYPKAILDEIQKEPQIVESIKSVYDQFEDPRYILLGSSQILLQKKIRESLAGRCQIIELYPLTLPEIMTKSWDDEIKPSYFQKLLSGEQTVITPFLLESDHAERIKIFDTYLQYGGYPAISDTTITDEEKKDWLKNYVRTYLERDIRDLAEIRNLEPFTKVQKILALNTAKLTNYSKIATEAGISSKTVQRFMEYMNISYQTIVLQPWSGNKTKRLVKSPKVHFMDIGILRTILQKNDALNGFEFESAVVSEIYKQAKQINKEMSFYHLRTNDGREIDLLIETEHGYLAIEIKESEKVREVDAKHFNGLEEILDKPIIHKFVISKDLNSRELSHGVMAVSAVQFLS